MNIEIKVSPIKVELGVSGDVFKLLEFAIGRLLGTRDDDRSVETVRDRLLRDIGGLPDLDAVSDPLSVVPHTETPVTAAPISGAVAGDLPAVADMPAPRPVLVGAGEGATLKVWTDERNEFLSRHYPAGMTLDDLLNRLAALPGKVMTSRNGVAVQANKLGLRREFKDGEPIEAAKPAGNNDQPPVASTLRTSNQPVAAPWSRAMRWAQQNQIDTLDGSDDEVLQRINAERDARGLPRFICDDEQELAA